MSLSNLHTLSSVVFDCDLQADTAVIVTGIRSSNLASNINYQREITNGNAWAHFGSIYGATPGGRFSTLDVARCGAAIGLQGCNLLTSDEGLTGFTLFGRKKAPGGVRVAQGTQEHVAFTAIEGIAAISGISAGHQTDAAMDVEFVAVSSDGATAPFIEDATSVDAVPPDDTHRFTLGPITLANAQNSITLTSKTNVDLMLRPTIETFGSDSDIYPSKSNITTFVPMLRITTLDVSLFEASIPHSGRLVTGGSGSYFYLRKRSKSTATGFVANNATEHIKFTLVDGLAYHTEIFDASSPDGNAQAVIEIPLIGTGSAFPLTVNWQSAIT